MKNGKFILFRLSLLLTVVNCFSLNLGAPSMLIPTARLALAASYDVGGYAISNDSVPSMMNRFQGHCTFAPFSFLNIGIDAGACRVDVAGDTTGDDTVGIFNGDYGFSGGARILLGSGFFYNDLVRIIGIAKGTYFTSSGARGVKYSGMDGAGTVGLQFRIPRFGFVTAGPELYLINGKCKDYLEVNHRYSNVSNIRGWLAIDFFPKEKIAGDSKLFISLEMALAPKATFNKRAPLQEIRFTVGLGSITKRLYGETSEVDWTP